MSGADGIGDTEGKSRDGKRRASREASEFRIRVSLLASIGGSTKNYQALRRMLRQAVVFLMSANPFPKEAVFYEMPDSAVMGAHTRRPVFTESLCFETKSAFLTCVILLVDAQGETFTEGSGGNKGSSGFATLSLSSFPFCWI